MPRLAPLLCAALLLASCGDDTRNTASTPPPTTADTPAPAAPERAATPVAHQSFHDEDIRLSPAITRFIPPGYRPLDTSAGDLNDDAYPDLALVLAKAGEDTASNLVDDRPEPRPLLLLTGDAASGYTLAARSDKAVYCIDCGGMMGDPFMDITIKNGYFSVEHYGGASARWEHILTFKYAPDERRWLLHRDGLVSFSVDAPDKPEERIKTTKDFGRVLLEDYDIYKDL